MQTMKVKKGDTVQITAGKDRGKQGRVVEAHPGRQKVVVENLNLIRRHQRPRPITNSSRMGGPTMTPGGIIDMPSAIPVGNVMVVCPVCNRPTRVGMKDKESHGEQVKVRVCKRVDCGEEIDR